METLAPFLDLGWCELRGVRTSDWSYVRAPLSELYDLRSDPDELDNQIERYPRIAEQLEGWCAYFARDDAGLQAAAAPDPDWTGSISPEATGPL